MAADGSAAPPLLFLASFPGRHPSPETGKWIVKSRSTIRRVVPFCFPNDEMGAQAVVQLFTYLDVMFTES